MTIATHTLPASYTDNSQLPRVLRAFEGYFANVYDDKVPATATSSGHFASIGIGLNIRGNQDALRLVLDYLGVFQADNASQEALRLQAGLAPRTQAEILARHNAIVADFSAVIASHPLNRTTQAEGASPSEITLTTALTTRLAFYGVASGFEILSESDARVLKMRLVQGGYAVGPYTIQGFQARLDTLLAGTGIGHNTREYMALMSLYFNGEGQTIPANSKLVNALKSDNRAEAWFEIRYGSNGGASSGMPGIASRRYFESELFGLYNNPSNVPPAEAQQVFAMLTKHRAEILAYEAKWGVPPDGTSSTRNMINETLTTKPDLAAMATIQTLSSALTPARDTFITWVNTQLPAGVAPLVAADWNPAALYYQGADNSLDDGHFNPTLDARSLDGKANGMNKNLIVGGVGGNILFGGKGEDFLLGNAKVDMLTGGEGSDTLIGGAGEDIYIWNTGDGNDTIVDADGGRLIINGTTYRFGGGTMIKDGASNVWKDPTGNVKLTHNSPWRLELADGSVIELGEDFDPQKWNIDLEDVSAAAPATTRTIVGDLAPIDADPVEAGLQYGHDDLGNVLVDANQAESGRADVLYDSAGNDDIRGLGGNDRIEASRGGDDRIDGGEGDDTLMGRAGNDIVIGGTGMDTLRGDGGRDELYAGSQVTLDAAFAAQEGATSGLKGDFIDGSEGDDVLVGEVGNDALNGGADADIILGGAGDDDIRGDFKTSNVQSNWTTQRSISTDANGVKLYTLTYNGVEFSAPTAGGDDSIYAGAGVDWVDGEFGDDYIDGGSGDDVLLGSEGSDFVLGGTGNDVMDGDSAYTAVAQQGDDYLDGGAGNDELSGSGGNDQLFGGTGDDLLRGDGPVNILPGAAHGSDYLDGEDGNDTLLGGGKDDILYGGAGDDLLMGDNDQLAAEFHGADYLDGEDGNDTLLGGGGDDVLIGGNGNDYLNGGSGADYMEGGAGNNTYVVDSLDDIIFQDGTGTGTVLTQVSYALGDGLANITLTGEAAIDAVGNANDNVISDNAGINTLTGGAGNDVYFVSNVEDSVVELGGEGFDTVSTAVSFSLSDNIEQLNASGVADVDLTGNAQDNTLIGNAGNNVLSGGAGNDYLVADAGNDVYVFARGDGQDTIQNTDFLRDTAQAELPQAVDILRFGAGISDADVIGYRTGDDVVFKVRGTTDQVRVSGYYSADVVDGTRVSDHKIDQVVFADGVVWDQTMIQTLVDQASNNQAPTLNSGLPALQARVGLAFSYVVPASTITDQDAGDTVSYSVSMQDGSALPPWLQFDVASRTLSGTPDATSIGALDFVLIGTDIYGVSTGVMVNLTVAENQAPVLAAPLTDQSTIRGGEFSYILPGSAFADPDAEDTLTYSATLADGSALPPWLVFDAQTRSFSGIPDTLGTISVRVLASDWSSAQASDIFDITVEALITTGTAGNDTLNGSVGDDVIIGLGGDDVLNGGGGNDDLYGGDGSDTLNGQAGNDVLRGGAGNDTLNGGDGNDLIIGQGAINAGAGNDTIDVQSGTSTVVQGAGNDLVLLHTLGQAANIYLYDAGPAAGETKTLRFVDGTVPGDVKLSRSGSDLWLTWGPSSAANTARIISFFNFTANPQGLLVEFEAVPETVWTWQSMFAAANTPTENSDDIEGTSGNDVIDALGGNDTVRGKDGDDILNGGVGNDQLYGDAGNDTLTGGGGSDSLFGGDGNDTLAQGVSMDGGRGLNTYRVFEQNSPGYGSIYSGTDGGDVVLVCGGLKPSDIKVRREGDTGSVTLINVANGTTVTLAAFITVAGAVPPIAELRFESWPDVVWTAADLRRMALIGDDAKNVIYGYTDMPSELVGAGGDDQLMGGNANDVLDGGTGSDYLAGGLGSDTYVFGFDSGTDEVVDIADVGSNIIQLGAGITPSDLTLLRTGQSGGWGADGIGTMSPNDSLVLQVPSTGARLWITQFFKPNNTSAVSEIRFADGSGIVWTYADIVARAGASLSGVQNAQTGTAANDVFTVDNAMDTIGEAAGGGIDTVRSSVSYVLPNEVENLDLVGALALSGKGNSLNNVLRGNSGDNLLRGAGGTDQYYGGQGNDTYIDSAYRYSDLGSLVSPVTPQIYENPNEGYDTLITDAWSITLPENVERLLVPTTMAIYSYSYYPSQTYVHTYNGNSLDNYIDLNGALVGSTGTGNSVRINGGAGSDTMIGTSRFDTYVVDNIGDVVIEKYAGTGGGQVESSVTYTLGSNLSNLILTGNVSIDGFGNELSNTIDGSLNSSANLLVGHEGNDTYRLGLGDTVLEQANGGNDKVILQEIAVGAPATIQMDDWANIETLELGANVGSLNVVGNAADNTIYGSLDSNEIYGLGGNDILYNLNPVHVAYNSIYSYYPYPTSSDRIDGGEGNDAIYSYGGYDRLFGGGGNDSIYLTDTGFSTVDGGAGDDRVTSVVRTASYSHQGLLSLAFGEGDGQDRVAIQKTRTDAEWQANRGLLSMIALKDGVDASELRFVRYGTDLEIVLGSGADSVTIEGFYAGVSDTTIVSSMDAIRLSDGTIMTREAIAAAVGLQGFQDATTGNDLLITSQSMTAVDGGDGDDLIYGQEADDQLSGSSGNDRVHGGAGSDMLAGGAGNDFLVGGHGADSYTFSLGWGQDVIDDIQQTERALRTDLYLLDDGGQDTIVFDTTVSMTDIQATRVADDLIITHIGTGDSIKVVNYFYPEVWGLAGQIEKIRFSDGMEWDRSYVVDLIKTVRGTEGDDTLYAMNMDSVVYGYAGNDTLYGGNYSDELYGGTGDDILDGGDGHDRLDGEVGADQMRGSYGNDVYVVDSASDVVTEYSDEGWDTVESSITYTLGSNLENLTLTGSAAINATGNSQDNILTGNGANNVLSGGTGADQMIGAGGDDTYVVDNVNDEVNEYENEGVDTVQSRISYVLGSSLENLTLTGTSSVSATGNELNNVLTGNSAANVLTGGAGNDTYVVGTGDTTIEAVDGGMDTVQSSITWTLANNVENLVLTGSSSVNGTGNALNNVLTGNSGTNVLTGGAGDDIYIVGTGDTTTEASGGGTDTVQSSVTWTLANNVENLVLTGTNAINGTGNTLANVITGNSANNALNGGTGADTLIGGAGNDTYTVDNVGDIIAELSNEGVDLVSSSVTYTLAANVENLTLTGSSALSATGNELNNVLTGNSGANVLTGGAGNDTYVVGTGDTTIEAAGEGIDTVQSSITWTLANNVENLILTGTSAINGTGNALDNVLTGNSGTNVLTGGAGNDTYVVTTGDTTTEAAGGGTDTVQSAVAWTLATNVENLTLTGAASVNGTGNTTDNVLLGNSGANTLTGNAGNDTLDGNAGADILIGGTGNDIYWLGRGYGADSIQENDATAGNTDLAMFGVDIATDQLWFRQVGNNLEISVIGTMDSFNVKDWYLGGQYHVEQLKTADGKTLLDTQVQSLVQAMAAFTPPPAGQTTLPESYAATLTPVIAANWQ